MTQGLSLRRLVVLAAVAAAAAAGSGAAVASCGAGTSARATIGRPAPVWSGPTIAGGPLSLTQERGHWVVLNLFATWCNPCRAETPQLVGFAAAQARQTDGARIVGVLYSDSVADARSFQRGHGVTWPVLADASGDTAAAYGVAAGLPQSWIISPGGVVTARIFGGVTVARLDAAVRGSG